LCQHLCYHFNISVGEGERREVQAPPFCFSIDSFDPFSLPPITDGVEPVAFFSDEEGFYVVVVVPLAAERRGTTRLT